MDKKEEKELKEKISKFNFNNDSEDLKIINENIDINEVKRREKNKNIFIIILGAVIALLIVILIVVLLTSKGNNNNNNNNSNSESKNGENNSSNNDTPRKKEEITSDSTIIKNKYVLLTDISNNKTTITDLDGNVIDNLDGIYSLYTYNNDVVLGLAKGDFRIAKTIANDSIVTIYDGKSTNMVFDDKHNLVGFYNQEEDSPVLYLFKDKGYEEISLGESPVYNHYIYNLSYENDINLYNGKYFVTAKKVGKSFKDFGVYDVSSKKLLFTSNYIGIEYLHDDIFVAIKGDKSGIIDANNKVLVDLKYDSISYSNGLYFAADGNSLYVLNSKFEKLDSVINVDNLSSYSYNLCCGNINPYELINYKNNVIVKINYDKNVSEYVVVDKNGHLTSLGKANIAIVGDYLVKTSNENTILNVYDSSLKIQNTIDTKITGLKLDSCYLYLGNTLVVNGTKFYSLVENKDLGNITRLRRTSQGYEVKLEFSNGKGTVTILKDDVLLKEISDVYVTDFLAAPNNGITVIKNYLIFNAGKVAIIKGEVPMTAFLN